MLYKNMGCTGVKVSEICLGTMTFGKEADEDMARAIMDRAAELGVNFFDTANVYNQGLTEEIVGRWLLGRRESFVIASKVYFPTGEGPNERGSSRRNIRLSVEKSLKRLQTDWLDILYLHHWDEETDIGDSLRAVDDLIRQGKVLYLAVSNFSAWQVMKAFRVAERFGFATPVAMQPMYSLVKRQAEVELLPMAQSEHLAVFPYNPLAAGLLTGKYLGGGQGRLTENKMYATRYADPGYADVAARFVAYARQHGHSPAALAAAWVNSHPAVTAAIIGARNLDQFNDTMGCLDLCLTPDMRAEISALSPEPPQATDRERNVQPVFTRPR